MNLPELVSYNFDEDGRLVRVEHPQEPSGIDESFLPLGGGWDIDDALDALDELLDGE